MSRDDAPKWDDDYTEVPLCPHCNAEYTDPWEHNLGDGDTAHTDCGECGGKFKITGQITCEYMTEKEL